MLVNAIGSNRNLYINKSIQSNSSVSVPYVKNTNSVDTVSFTGLRPEIIRNQFKILLSQDIWATKLAVRMPEGGLEKEALLELLEHRAKLDRFARLNNRRAEIITKISYAQHLSQTDPTNPELAKILAELDKLGNIDSVLSTMEKQIQEEAVRNKPALDYFKNLEKLEEEYSARKLIRDGQLDKFWHKIVKGNINAEGQYSTPELIEIIKSGKVVKAAEEVVATAPRITSKKDLLAVVRADYRQLLREDVNVYATNNNHTPFAKHAQAKIQEKYDSYIKKFEVSQGRLDDIYKYVEREFNTQVENILDVDIYPLGEHWNQMVTVESSLRTLRRDINQLKSRLKNFPDDAQAKSDLAKKLSELETTKKLWILGMKKSVQYEAVNRGMMEKAGKIQQYDYLTGENKIIKLHKEALAICEENSDELPEEMWSKILS